MVHRYYDKPLDPEAPNPFRCDGFLRDGIIPRRGGGHLAIHKLPPFLRALLVTDGTVTKILEAYFWEPVEVQTLQQDFVSAERSIDWIHVHPEDPVLFRRARLRGVDSGEVYATAVSVIRTELIPAALRQRLIDREIGIGVLIRDSGLESYREVLEVGVEAVEPGKVTEPGRSDIVYRTYRIIIEREPVILITESFPLRLYS
ncbi:MAG: chorismate pyruvate-lyase family protein [Pseudomonadota bacterium]|nr:chorismate pyruvate-lyase family protein [Pseudomonadota bacterium]